MQYGRNVLSGVVGHDIRASFDGSPDWVPIGITLDWSKFAAVGSDTTLPNGDIILSGQKYARYGQVVTKITNAEVQTVDLSGGADPTAGTWTLTIQGETITGIAWDVTAAVLQAAIRALSFNGAFLVTVSKSGFVYTVTFPANTGNADAITASGAGLTGGQTITITTTNAGESGGGSYGPYDPAASDGRQTLTPGSCAILDQTVRELGAVPGLSAPASNYPSAFDGGPAWEARIIQSGVATHTLALGPTKVELQAAFPRLRLVASA